MSISVRASHGARENTSPVRRKREGRAVTRFRGRVPTDNSAVGPIRYKRPISLIRRQEIDRYKPSEPNAKENSSMRPHNPRDQGMLHSKNHGKTELIETSFHEK
jgi:hypothetical protein